jgi:hypothetical protein
MKFNRQVSLLLSIFILICYKWIKLVSPAQNKAAGVFRPALSNF